MKSGEKWLKVGEKCGIVGKSEKCEKVAKMAKSSKVGKSREKLGKWLIVDTSGEK